MEAEPHTPLELLDLGSHALFALLRAGVLCIEHVDGLSDKHLLQIPGVGVGTLRQIHQAIPAWKEGRDWREGS